jgi:hypothetical protein
MSKKEWGNATWYLFHTLAEKIDETYFRENKSEFFHIITIICKNLPCPECAEDASIILKNANLNNIQSKELLKEFFFQFHNRVNAKLKKPIFNKDDLIKYKSAVTLNIMKNFIHYYFTRGYNEKMLMQSFSVNNIETPVKKYLVDLYNQAHIAH